MKRNGLIIALLLSVSLCFSNAFDDARRYQQRIRDAISDTIKWLHVNGVYDANGDGLVNCIDWTFLFYAHFPEMTKKHRVSANCQMRRNINDVTGMNHLFAYVCGDGGPYCVEPQSRPGTDWNMSAQWGNRYNPMCNSRDETIWWVDTMSSYAWRRESAFNILGIKGW